MNNKYVELEEWEKLRKSGAITEAEFENEKNKLLYEKSEVKEKNTIAKQCFKFVAVATVFLIVMICLAIYHNNKGDKIAWNTSVYENRKEMDEEYEKGDSYRYASIMLGSIVVVVLTIGVVTYIKENGGIKIVD